jgi:hypothetical protein
MKTLMAVMALAVILAGCHNAQLPAKKADAPVTYGVRSDMIPAPSCGYECGYRHLMKALIDRNLHTCETLQDDGTTCLTVTGKGIKRGTKCALTRDDAAEAMAKFIDNQLPKYKEAWTCLEK